MRKFILGLAALLGLGFGVLAPEPASAQRLTISVGSGYGGYYNPYRSYYRPYRPYYGAVAYRRPVVYTRRVYYPRPVYYARPVYARPVYARPVYYAAPRCRTKVVQRWNGWNYVNVRKRTCR